MSAIIEILQDASKAVSHPKWTYDAIRDAARAHGEQDLNEVLRAFVGPNGIGEPDKAAGASLVNWSCRPGRTIFEIEQAFHKAISTLTAPYQGDQG